MKCILLRTQTTIRTKNRISNAPIAKTSFPVTLLKKSAGNDFFRDDCIDAGFEYDGSELGIDMDNSPGAPLGVCEGSIDGALLELEDGMEESGEYDGFTLGIGVGKPLGASLGVSEGCPDGTLLGLEDGIEEGGENDGFTLGIGVGKPLGASLGVCEGCPDGALLGLEDGIEERGEYDGFTLGIGVGKPLGAPLGVCEGCPDGTLSVIDVSTSSYDDELSPTFNDETRHPDHIGPTSSGSVASLQVGTYVPTLI